MKVPFVDLKVQFESISDEINEAIQQVLHRSAFAGGVFVEKFEKEFATFCESQHAIGVGSGTEALWLALLALGIGPGDEVITVANTFIATAEAITFCGAKPVFVDIDEKTYTMDPHKLDEYLRLRNRKSNRLKAIIPVHLFGQMADMDPIMEIAKSKGLYVIEDASQAHGAEYKGRPAGSIGDAGCFSFYPGKNLGAYGEAGAIVTNDPGLDKSLRMLRDHGQSKKYNHGLIGWNARMDGLQGAVLSVKLKHLRAWNEKRRINASIYNQLSSDLEEVFLPKEADYGKHVYHIYAICSSSRDALVEALSKKQVYCGIHYPIPIHLQEAYHFLAMHDGSLPITELCASKFVSLPMYPELSKEQIQYVVTEIKCFNRHK